MTTTPTKFLFETSFDGGVLANAAAPAAGAAKPRVYTHAQIEAIQHAAFNQGKTASKAEAMATVEGLTAQTLTRLEQQITATQQQMDQIAKAHAEQAAKLAFTMIKKLLPYMAGRETLVEVETLLNRTLEAALGEQQLVITISEAAMPLLQGRLQQILKAKGFEGRVQVSGDSSMQMPDAKVTWRDGGAEHRIKSLWQQLEAVAYRAFNGDDSEPELPLFS
ncbi:MAG: FliH/SctL family protein [Dongiaceae bacterium]